MDYTNSTNLKLNLALVASFLFAVGAIINYFHQNHTPIHTKIFSGLHKTIPLPPDAALANTRDSYHLLYTATFTVRQNDTLATIFYRAGLDRALWITILNTPGTSRYLEQLPVGSKIQLMVNKMHELVSLQTKINPGQTFEITKKNDQWVASIKQEPITKTVEFDATTIHGNLTDTVKKTGLPSNLQNQIETMLSKYATHPGEKLEVLYHEYFAGDQKDHPGNVVAAELIDGKTKHRIVRFTENHSVGYFTPQGQSTQPQFLKFPLHYERIGSYFSYHRLDPFTHRVQPHLGVDFDAPEGTPVKAIANGRIVACNDKLRGYGNVIIVQYNKVYQSLYAHLEKFAKNLHPNEYVKKGQIIGYVGMTGWATGPHLHFAIYKNGVAVNPLTVQFPYSAPIEAKYRRAFFYDEDRWFDEMKLFSANEKRN